MGGKHDRNRTKAMVLKTVADAEDGIKSADVVAIVKMTRAAVQLHLLRLTQERAIHRQLLGGKKGYLYWAGEDTPTALAIVERAEEEESDADVERWFLAKGFGEAIEAARPSWRVHHG